MAVHDPAVGILTRSDRCRIGSQVGGSPPEGLLALAGIVIDIALAGLQDEVLGDYPLLTVVNSKAIAANDHIIVGGHSRELGGQPLNGMVELVGIGNPGIAGHQLLLQRGLGQLVVTHAELQRAQIVIGVAGQEAIAATGSGECREVAEVAMSKVVVDKLLLRTNLVDAPYVIRAGTNAVQYAWQGQSGRWCSIERNPVPTGYDAVFCRGVHLAGSSLLLAVILDLNRMRTDVVTAHVPFQARFVGHGGSGSRLTAGGLAEDQFYPRGQEIGVATLGERQHAVVQLRGGQRLSGKRESDLGHGAHRHRHDGLDIRAVLRTEGDLRCAHGLGRDLLVVGIKINDRSVLNGGFQCLVGGVLGKYFQGEVVGLAYVCVECRGSDLDLGDGNHLFLYGNIIGQRGLFVVNGDHGEHILTGLLGNNGDRRRFCFLLNVYDVVVVGELHGLVGGVLGENGEVEEQLVALFHLNLIGGHVVSDFRDVYLLRSGLNLHGGLSGEIAGSGLHGDLSLTYGIS